MTKTIKPNLPLLLKVREAIRQTRKSRLGPRWNQAVWREYNPFIKAKTSDHRCQTAMCFAGWAVELDNQTRWLYSAKEIAALRAKGYFVSEGLVIVPEKHVQKLTAFSVYNDVWTEKHLITGVTHTVTVAAAWAQYRLGLTDEQRGDLFDGSNDLREINSLIRKIEKQASNG